MDSDLKLKQPQLKQVQDQNIIQNRKTRIRRNTVQHKLISNKSACINKIEKKVSSNQIKDEDRYLPSKSGITSSTGNLHYRIGVPVKYQSVNSPPQKDKKQDITDSDSKKFFEEVFDENNDIDKMLLDMPLITDDSNIEDGPDSLVSEIKREIQTMKQTELKNIFMKEVRNINSSDDEDGLWDVGNEMENDDHSSIPKLSMKMRTIKDINK